MRIDDRQHERGRAVGIDLVEVGATFRENARRVERPLLRQLLEATYRIVLNEKDLGLAYSLTPTHVPATPQRSAPLIAPKVSVFERRAGDQNGGQRAPGTRLIAFYLPMTYVPG